jgi:hypothetical protein
MSVACHLKERIMFETVFGPVDGCYAALCIRPAKDQGKFFAEYKICLREPEGYFQADPVRIKQVAGSCDSASEAQELAAQLARLEIANLKRGKSKRAAAMAQEDHAASSGFAQSSAFRDAEPDFYQPTEPAPLADAYPATQPAPLGAAYYATVPASL